MSASDRSAATMLDFRRGVVRQVTWRDRLRSWRFHRRQRRIAERRAVRLEDVSPSGWAEG
ncbi:MAG TPA: hypothetical protein VMU39_01455 [Solirubrobacteraceae bacterium]|nr:hypothetical protein [Solirubrobacteraceae bacterium]